jgi:iron complex transport system substrate-binding protein
MNKCVRRVLLSASLMAMLAAQPMSGAALAQTTIVDSGGREVRVDDTSKILSIGGDITEILYAIGADKRVVAVDATSQFPTEALKEKKSVGYMRALSSEGVLSVGASVIVASDRSGPPEVVKALKTTNVPYVEVGEAFNATGIAKKVRMVARVVRLEQAGEELATKMEREFAALQEARATIRKPVRALFVLAVQNGRVTVGGSDTSADAILTLAGAENAARAVHGFKPLSDEALLELRPDFIVTMRRSGSGHETDQLLAVQGIAATPAGAAKRIVSMDGLYLLGFGPRTAAAALDLMHAFYPELPSKRAEPTR